MFEWLNKYTLELAIDQEKINRWETPEIEWDDIEWYHYWNQSFMSREQAFYWIRKQSISYETLRREIDEERNLYNQKWEVSPLEDLIKTYIYYLWEKHKETEVTKDNLKKLVIVRAKKNPIVFHSADKWLFRYFEWEELKYKPSERILPLTDILNNNLSDKSPKFTIDQLWDFIQKSIKELSWEEILLEYAKDLASRLVIITWRNENWEVINQWNWFIYQWAIFTNQHVVEWPKNSYINIRDLQWNEFRNIKIHQIRNPQMISDWVSEKWKRDIAYITSHDINTEKYKNEFAIPLLWTYLIWVKNIEKSISLWQESNKNPLALYVNKVTIEDNPKDSWEWVIYTEWATTIPWTSWSMILHNWKIIWINSFSQDVIPYYIPLLNIPLSIRRGKKISWWGELFEWISIN